MSQRALTTCEPVAMVGPALRDPPLCFGSQPNMWKVQQVSEGGCKQWAKYDGGKKKERSDPSIKFSRKAKRETTPFSEPLIPSQRQISLATKILCATDTSRLKGGTVCELVHCLQACCLILVRHTTPTTNLCLIAPLS